jgi:TonB family protein
VTSAPLAPWVFAALAIHVVLAVATPRAAERRDEPPPPLEIDLSPPAPPPVFPRNEEPPAPDPAPPPVAAPARPLAPAAPRAAAPAAHAAAVLTAAPSAPDTPVSFVTDPSGASFGYGVVMRGGTAEQASSAPGVPPAPPPRTPSAPVETSAPRSDWTRAPRLDEADPCSGFFPRHALADAGKVTLAVVIEPGGHVTSASVVEEAPPRDGFGEAARTCLRTKVFAPALGRDGRPVRATATVRIRFSR